jgi:hypothetical protein
VTPLDPLTIGVAVLAILLLSVIAAIIPYTPMPARHDRHGGEDASRPREQPLLRQGTIHGGVEPLVPQCEARPASGAIGEHGLRKAAADDRRPGGVVGFARLRPRESRPAINGIPIVAKKPGETEVCAPECLVSQTFASWNRIPGSLRRLEGLRGAV